MVLVAGASHNTATLSAGDACGLHELRLMHRRTISLTCFGPRAVHAFFRAGAFLRICHELQLHSCTDYCAVSHVKLFTIHKYGLTATL